MLGFLRHRQPTMARRLVVTKEPQHAHHQLLIIAFNLHMQVLKKTAVIMLAASNTPKHVHHAPLIPPKNTRLKMHGETLNTSQEPLIKILSHFLSTSCS